MQSKRLRYAFIYALTCLPILLLSQSFHKQFNNSQNLFSQKILATSDGGYIIGDSYLTEGEIYLTKFFYCGEVEWSQRYQIEDAFAEFKDFVINTKNELLVFGSYFVGSEELIFLQKVNLSTGNQISFSTFDPIFRDHFTYSIDIKDGRVMIFGLLIDFNIDRRGFIALFDENLNLRWSKDFTPFDKEGDAIIIDDGFMCRAEVYHFKLSLEGEFVWAKKMESPNIDLIPIGGPYQEGNSFLYEATIGSQNFFYLLDGNGNLIWESELFESTGERSSIENLDENRKSVFHYFEEDGEIKIASLELSQDGEISNQQSMQADRSFISGDLFHLIDKERLTIVGSPNPFTNAPNAFQDFVIQQNTAELALCYNWASKNKLEQNDLVFNFLPYTFATEDLGMEKISNKTVIKNLNDLTFTEICSDLPESTIFSENIQIECGKEVMLTLPSVEFIWDDLKTNEVRSVLRPGIYSARTNQCGDPELASYEVLSPSCDCKVFLPNVFSPNNDGINDELEYYTSCRLTKLNFSVYNRWGEKIYQNKVLDSYWDGAGAESGSYIVTMDYEVLNEEGQIISASIVRDLTIVK